MSDRVLHFRRHLRAEVDPGQAAYLFSERGVVAMRGAQIAALAALLDGTRDFASVVRARPAGMGHDEVAALLARLVEADLLTVRAPDDQVTDGRAAAYWDACGIDAGAPAGGVHVVSLGDEVDAGAVKTALLGAGLDLAPRHQAGPALTLVLCADYLDPRLAEVDAAQRAAGTPWLLAKPVGSEVWLGPVLRPGESACWHCLTARLWIHRHAEACVQAELGHTGPAPAPVASVPPLTAAAAHLVALEITKWLAGYRYPGQDCVWVLDSLDLRGTVHELRRRPQCPECGDPGLVAERTRQPVVLRQARKIAGSTGGHRTSTPAQVLDRYRHLVSPVTGVVAEVGADPRSPAFANAFRSGPNVVRGLTGMNELRACLRGANGGKGVTALDAEVGALCEAVERYSGNFQGDELRIRGSLRSLGADAVHPNDCLLYSERQYRDRREWNRDHAAFQHVCEPFDAGAELDWTPLWSLTRQRQRLLPTGLLYYGAPDDGGLRCVRADSNGTAAGSSLEDAILQGLLELIERDAVALWWYNRTPVPGVDLAAFGDGWLAEMPGHHAGLGRQLWVLDVTADLGVPVMVAVSRRTGAGAERILFGFGAHLDPVIAARRAVSELNQLLPVVLDDGRPLDDPDANRWLEHATAGGQPYLRPLAEVPGRVPADFRYEPAADVRDDVGRLVTLLAGHGMETLVLDQTRPDIGLPVAKVLVPGLRSFWARFAPGRLFDVPVRLGRLAGPTPYAQLNPYPLFL
ncbi:TOMM precursor leader peptide-binding protein [Amycolatopsis suaedae]|uniref:YcaO domain-containing protein n=1 Tax=Amycolatopsis suaedae TaxID=2510978 RepID=A0A4Q7J3U6_9PSEU|nr:TOMM precursor leader peptide-binding protein [Amycolatopsis suaedae]RZQ61302.1 hypothetical protein EWH70_24990 [Amycolatopsis suaedae]